MNPIVPVSETGAYKHVKLRYPQATDEELVYAVLASNHNIMIFTTRNYSLSDIHHELIIEHNASSPTDGIYDIVLQNCVGLRHVRVETVHKKHVLFEKNFEADMEEYRIPLAFHTDSVSEPLTRAFMKPSDGGVYETSFIPVVGALHDSIKIVVNKEASVDVQLGIVLLGKYARRSLAQHESRFFVDGKECYAMLGIYHTKEEYDEINKQRFCCIC